MNPLALAAAAVETAAEGEGGFSSPFEVNFGLFFWTWVVFIALFFLLKRFAWPAILRVTEERERTIKQEMDQARKANEESQRALEEHRKLLSSAKSEAHELVNDAKVTAQKEREHLLAQARREQEEILERAKREIDAERDRAVAQLRREAVELSLAAASRLVQEQLDEESNRKVVEDYLDSLDRQT